MSPSDPGCAHPAPEPAAEGELLRILEGYQAEAEAGRPVDTAEAIAAHPELADELRTCLRVMRLADRMARRLQGGAEVSASSGRLRRAQDALGQLSDVAREAVGRARTGLTTELSAALSDSLATSWPTADLEANLPETEAASVTGRYRLLARISRGGMGVVYRARDDVLDRELAVKVIRDDCRGDPRCLHRFLEEARIEGRLQHPGVVPVYDVGHLGDLRPFFAMKLVEGRTLAELLVQRSSPSEELSRLLAIFEAVCRTMAYAHASGVVHRDLKPANVMVGPFGEVQVMDWGLAKVVGRDGGEAASLDDSPAPDEVGAGARLGACEAPATQPGSVLGTPSYMAPEQARGQTDHVDERADVFGLGAILCEVLTGRPPFTGATPAEIRRKAADANLAEALAVLDGCGADAELVRLARRCLAAEPEGRPRNAAAVAEAVTAYQDGVQERLRAVERKRVQAEATAASEQKRRRVQVSLAASLSGLFLVVVIGWLAFERIERNQRIVLRGEVNSAINEANRLEGEARGGPDLVLWDRAVEAARRAESLDRGGGGRSGLGGQVTRLLTRLRDAQQQAHVRAEIEARDRTMVAALEQARFEGMELTAGLSSDYRGPVSAYRTAFKTYGIDVDGLPESELSARLNASAIRGELAAALGDWAFRVSSSAEKSRLLRLTHTIDPDPLRDAVRNAVAQNDVAALKALAQRKDLALLPAVTIEILGAALSDLGAAHEALAVLRVGQQQYPGNLWLNHDLALLLGKTRPTDFQEVVRYFSAALALKPGDAHFHYDLGAALLHTGKPDQALAEFRRAIAIKPNLSEAHLNLGNLLAAQANWGEAAEEFRRAVALKPDLPEAHNDLGACLRVLGKFDEAIQECQRALALRPDYASAVANLASVYLEQGNLEQAITEFHHALALRPDSADIHNNLGGVFAEQGKWDEAINAFQRALALKPDDAEIHGNLGVAFAMREKLDQAIAEFRRALALNPGEANMQIHLGRLLRREGQYADALAAFWDRSQNR